jgi:hypothetical protein
LPPLKHCIQVYKRGKNQKADILKENWSVDNGLLTPTLKIKSTQVEMRMGMYKSWFENKKKKLLSNPEINLVLDWAA